MICIPALSLVLLLGCSGSGLTTFARRHFAETEVVSLERCRDLVADGSPAPEATEEAWGLARDLVRRRLVGRRLVVVDAPMLRAEERRPFLRLARELDTAPTAIVLDLDVSTCLARLRARGDRVAGREIGRERGLLRDSLGSLRGEGFREVFRLQGADEVEAAAVERVPLSCDRAWDRGPFDIIGDVHGCSDELEELLERLGYEPDEVAHRHPAGRRAVFVGDLVDRGPRILDACRLVGRMVEAGQALCVIGNHDDKLLRKLRGASVQVSHGLERSLHELEALSGPRRDELSRGLERFFDARPAHLVLDEGRLVVAHAGLPESLQGRVSRRVRAFCLYGETTGEVDAFGLPVRLDWAAAYRGSAAVVYGHTPVPEPRWASNTINIDGGCVFGGSLVALRWPERTLVSVPARRTWYHSPRPLSSEDEGGKAAPARTSPSRPVVPRPRRSDERLDFQALVGSGFVRTALLGDIPVRAEAAAAALEVVARWGVDPRWLVHVPASVPPVMRAGAGLVEHPADAAAAYREEGMTRVACQALQAGTRVVVVACRSEAAAQAAFGVGAGVGAVYTRAARPALRDSEAERAMLDGVREACERSGLFEDMGTDWLVLEAVAVPRPAVTGGLPRADHAALAAAASASLERAAILAGRAEERGGEEARALGQRMAERHKSLLSCAGAVERHSGGHGRLRLAVLHVLASRAGTGLDRPEAWHAEVRGRLEGAAPDLFAGLRCLEVDVDEAGVSEAVRFWDGVRAQGAEGLIVRPLTPVSHGPRGLVVPARKVRTPEALRLVYGPYGLYGSWAPDPGGEVEARCLDERAVRRARVSLQQFALGLEALERFTRGEPLQGVHHCVIGALALEGDSSC